MKTLTTLTITVTVLFALAACADRQRDDKLKTAITTTSTTRPPAPAPIPSTPDTAAPIVTTTPPSTTLPAPEPQPEPEPAPEPQPEAATVTTDGGDDIEIWLAMGRCEQPGNEWGGVRWSHPGPRYQGGLGFYFGTWDQYKQGTSAEGIDNAGDATPMQQIEVARRVRDAHGYHAWGCATRLGL